MLAFNVGLAFISYNHYTFGQGCCKKKKTHLYFFLKTHLKKTIKTTFYFFFEKIY